jgi:hypothetical protein
MEAYVQSAKQAEEEKSRKRRRREALERTAFQPPSSYDGGILAATGGA